MKSSRESQETAEKCLTVIISSYEDYSVLRQSLTWSRRWHLPAGCHYSGNGWNRMTPWCGCSSRACWLYGSQPCPQSSKCPAGERRTPIRRRGESPHLSGKQRVNINQANTGATCVLPCWPITCSNASICQVRRDCDPPAFIDAHAVKAAVHPSDESAQAHLADEGFASVMTGDMKNNTKGKITS